jgi:hypothetical protein
VIVKLPYRLSRHDLVLRFVRDQAIVCRIYVSWYDQVSYIGQCCGNYYLTTRRSPWQRVAGNARVFLYTELLSFRRKVKEWMDWVVPLRGWKSGGVIGTTTIVRRKTRKGLGGDDTEYSFGRTLTNGLEE